MNKQKHPVRKKYQDPQIEGYGQGTEKKKTIRDLLKEIGDEKQVPEDKNQITVLTLKIEITWPEDSQHI